MTKTDLILKRNQIPQLGRPTHSENDSNFDRLMYWSGTWIAGVQYEEHEVVLDSGYLAIANKLTEERPAPQTQGPEYLTIDLSTDAPPVFLPLSSVATLIYYGARYTLTKAAFIHAVRFYVPPGTEGFSMAVFVRRDPLGSPVTDTLVSEFVVSVDQVDRWIVVPLGEQIVDAGVVFDVYAALRTTSGDNTFVYTWDYLRGAGDPISGQAIHQNNNQSDLRFHQMDFGGTDRTTDLDNIVAGSIIAMANGLTWNVTDTVKIGQVYYFTVDPAARSAAATAAFEFTFFAPLPIPYGRDDDYWLSVTAIQGLFSPDGDPDSEVLDQHLYGIDLSVQDADVSDDWDLLASTNSGSGSGGSSGASELITKFAVSWVGQATNGLCTILNERNGLEVERTGLGQYTLRFTPGVVEPATLMIPVAVVTGLAFNNSPEIRFIDVGVINPDEVLVNCGLRNTGGVFTDSDLTHDVTNFLAVIGERYS